MHPPTLMFSNDLLHFRLTQLENRCYELEAERDKLKMLLLRRGDTLRDRSLQTPVLPEGILVVTADGWLVHQFPHWAVLGPGVDCYEVTVESL